MGDKIPFLYVHSQEDYDRAMALLQCSRIKGWDRYMYDLVLPTVVLVLSATHSLRSFCGGLLP